MSSASSSSNLSSQNPGALPDPTGPKTRVIYCKVSGLQLGYVTAVISEGYGIWIADFKEALTLHPIYAYERGELLNALRSTLEYMELNDWKVSDAHKIRLRVLISAVIRELNCLKQDRPTLPSWPVAIGSAKSIYGLAYWYWNVSSSRLALPVYSVSAMCENLEFQNLKVWINDAFSVKKSWSEGKEEAVRLERLNATEQALKSLDLLKVYSRLDLRKIWNWIEIQLAASPAKPHLPRYKEIFFNGDTNSENWLVDDIEDMMFDVAEYCDTGNDIAHFIRTRLVSIREIIREFYSGFTLLRTDAEELKFEQTSQEKELFGGYEKQLDAMTELPPKPTRDQFPTNAAFWKAEANWNILKRVHDARVKKQELSSPDRPATATANATASENVESKLRDAETTDSPTDSSSSPVSPVSPEAFVSLRRSQIPDAPF